MNRIKCTLTYDGSEFSGFQVQPNKRTIAGEIEKVLERMHKEAVRIHASGRTDRGVHAKGQVIHFDSPLHLETRNWKKALNGLLPHDVYINDVEIVSEEFHARYSALAKEYHYYVETTSDYDVFSRKYAYYFPYDLQVDRVKEACKYLEGTHDFTTFSSNKASVKGSRIRTLYQVNCEEYPSGLRFVFYGDGFLYHMIRVLVSFLLDLGQGKWEVADIPKLFAAKNRSQLGKTIGPEGLYLMRVDYENE